MISYKMFIIQKNTKLIKHQNYFVTQVDSHTWKYMLLNMICYTNECYSILNILQNPLLLLINNSR